MSYQSHPLFSICQFSVKLLLDFDWGKRHFLEKVPNVITSICDLDRFPQRLPLESPSFYICACLLWASSRTTPLFIYFFRAYDPVFSLWNKSDVFVLAITSVCREQKPLQAARKTEVQWQCERDDECRFGNPSPKLALTRSPSRALEGVSFDKRLQKLRVVFLDHRLTVM